MKRVLLFAGATEGRELAEFLTGFPVELTVSTATEYGASLLPRGERVTCLSGRLDQGEMEGVIRQGGYRWVVDATHPYATQAGENIRRACEAVGVPLLRLSRQLDRPMEGAIAVPDAQAAAQLLNQMERPFSPRGARNSLSLHRWRILPSGCIRGCCLCLR